MPMSQDFILYMIKSEEQKNIILLLKTKIIITPNPF